MLSKIILPFVLFLLVLSSGGVIPLIMGGVIFYLVILVLLLCTILDRSSFPKQFSSRAFNFTILSVLVLSFIQMLNTGSFLDEEFTKFVFRFLVSFLLYYCFVYQKRSLQDDLYGCLKIITLHSLFGFVLAFFLLPFLTYVQVEERVKVFTFAYLFFYDSTYVFSDIVILRNQGMFWEPGVLAIYLNIFFFLCTFVKNRKKESILAAILIITTFSTTGYLLLIVQVLVLFKDQLKKNIVYFIPALILSAALVPFLIDNFSNKFQGDNDSFLLRFYDYFISLNIIKDHWLTGLGFGNELYKKAQLTYDLFRSSFLTEPRGNTNSITSLFASFGIIIGALIVRSIYKQSLVNNNRFLFFFVIFVSLSSEPLVYTGLFMVLIISGFVPPGKLPVSVMPNKLLLNNSKSSI